MKVDSYTAAVLHFAQRVANAHPVRALAQCLDRADGVSPAHSLALVAIAAVLWFGVIAGMGIGIAHLFPQEGAAPATKPVPQACVAVVPPTRTAVVI